MQLASRKQNALRVVQKLHCNLGHPSAQALVDLLHSRGASTDVLSVAENYLCSSCLRYKKPNQPAPATVQKADHFNQSIQADVFWIREEEMARSGHLGQCHQVPGRLSSALRTDQWLHRSLGTTLDCTLWHS